MILEARTARADYKEKPAYGAAKRAERSINRALGLWRRGDYDVRFLYLHGWPHYKKVVFRSREDASRVYSTLQAFGRTVHFPRPAWLDRHEVVVDFVRGTRLRWERGNRLMLSRLAAFFSGVYSRGLRLESLAKSGFWQKFEAYVASLQALGVLASGAADKLLETGRRLAPAQVFVGWDYIDPIENNLVVKEDVNALCAIDIKNLKSETLMGRGLAKARQRYLSQYDEEAIFDQLRQKGAPDFQPYFPFIRFYEAVRQQEKKLSGEAQLKWGGKTRRVRNNKLPFSSFAVSD
jgi:hypothetical protein